MTLFSISMIIMLLLGFPFMVVLLGSLILYITVYMPNMSSSFLVQQVLTGVTPAALVCVPMFILSANLITSGKSAQKLIRMVQAFVGHLPGGLPITANASCTLFGSVSGSTQATARLRMTAPRRTPGPARARFPDPRRSAPSPTEMETEGAAKWRK